MVSLICQESIRRKGLFVIYRQKILQDNCLFTSQPVTKFYIFDPVDEKK